jgi:hypothetical protein
MVNWEAIVHKSVRSSQGHDAGSVDAILGDIVVITTQVTVESIIYQKLK